MQKKPTFKVFMIAGIASASFGACAWWYSSYWQPKRTALWESRQAGPVRNNITRAPAQFSETDLPLIEDYFRYNSFHHFISYRLDIGLTASREESDAKKALSKTLHKLFTKEKRTDTLRAFASPTLVTDFISSYLEELDDENVSKGNYQLDLEFFPRSHHSVLFENEARAVSLWNLNQTKSLRSATSSRKAPAEVPANDEYSLIRRVITTDYPNEGQYYQYQGGVISLQLELDKFKWDSSERMAKKPEQLAGDLIYRRYFKIVHEDEFSFFIDHPDMTIRSTAMIRKHDAIPVFNTVDVSRDFNGHTLYSPSERLSVHIGEMIPTKQRKLGFFQRIFGASNQGSFNTGELRLYGRLGKGDNGIDFEMTIHTLVYDLQNKKFNAQDSRISVSLKNQALSAYDKASATNEIKKILLGPMAGDLIKSLALGRFHPVFKQSGGSR